MKPRSALRQFEAAAGVFLFKIVCRAFLCKRAIRFVAVFLSKSLEDWSSHFLRTFRQAVSEGARLIIRYQAALTVLALVRLAPICGVAAQSPSRAF